MHLLLTDQCCLTLCLWFAVLGWMCLQLMPLPQSLRNSVDNGRGLSVERDPIVLQVLPEIRQDLELSLTRPHADVDVRSESKYTERNNLLFVDPQIPSAHGGVVHLNEMALIVCDRRVFNDFGNGIWVGNHYDMGCAIDDHRLLGVSPLCHKR